MIGSSLLILYGIVSVLGAIVILITGSAKSASGYIYFFLLCHASLLAIIIFDLLTPIHFIWFLVSFVACIASRWLNGKYVFGKNNWLHYCMVASIFAVAYFLI